MDWPLTCLKRELPNDELLESLFVPDHVAPGVLDNLLFHRSALGQRSYPEKYSWRVPFLQANEEGSAGLKEEAPTTVYSSQAAATPAACSRSTSQYIASCV